MTEKSVKNGTDQAFKRGRGGKSRAGRKLRRNVRVESGGEKAKSGESGSDSPNQRCWSTQLFWPGRQIVQIHKGGGITFGKKAHGTRAIGRGGSNHVQRESGRDHMPLLMVGVVADDFAPSGRGKERHGSTGSKSLFEFPKQFFIPLELGGGVCIEFLHGFFSRFAGWFFCGVMGKCQCTFSFAVDSKNQYNRIYEQRKEKFPIS